MKSLLCALLLLPGLSLANLSLDQQSLNKELESVFQTIENNYGPLSYKERLQNMNWETRKEEYRNKLENLKDTQGYYFLIADLLHEFNDAHVSISLPTTFKKELPVDFVLVQNKAILSFYQNKITEASGCRLNLGDELIGLNGNSLEEVQNSSLSFNSSANHLTSTSIFIKNLSHLSESPGLDLSNNTVLSGDKITLNLKGTNDGSLKNCTLTFTKSGLGIISRTISKENEMNKWSEQQILGLENLINESNPNKSSNSDKEEPLLSKFEREHFKRLLNISYLANKLAGYEMKKDLIAGKNDGAVTGVGRKIDIAHALPLWEMPKNFNRIKGGFFSDPSNLFAGVFEKDGKKVGYLRIPSYEPANIMLSQFAIRKIMRTLEEKSDFLIIDQINNPGGYVIYSDLIVKSLVGNLDNSKHMSFAVKPTQSYMRNYLELIQAIITDIKTSHILTKEQEDYFLKNAKENFNKVQTAFNNQSDLSEPISLSILSEYMEASIDQSIKKNSLLSLLMKLKYGTKVFENHPYTKPVTMLINELDFSAGDATPAILQDYSRIKLIGVRTSGAGGSVEEL